MRDPMFTPKLDRDQRMLVFRMHAEGFKHTEIVKELKERFDITITKEALSQTCRAERNQPIVKQFRDSYLGKIKDVPIANKRIRIDDLEKARKKIVELMDGQPVKTRADRQEFLSLVRRLNETITVARDEMENKPNLVAGVVIGEFNDLSDEELRVRKRELIAKALQSDGGGDSRLNEDTEGTVIEGESQSS